MVTFEFPDFGEYLKMSFNEKNIPKDAVKTETVVEEKGYKTTTTIYEKEGYYCSITKREPVISKIDKLTLELNKAIFEQRFEDCAKLRDQIKNLNK